MYRWEDFNETAVEQARELAWQEREHVAHRRLVARERFEERAGFGEEKPEVEKRAVLAAAAFRTDAKSRMFRVLDEIAERYTGEWSEPVQFRFELHNGQVDLVMRAVSPPLLSERRRGA